MKILVIGSGGREHALCWKISQSPKVEKIFCAPGNAGTAEIAENINIQVMDFPKLADFTKSNNIDLTVVGPDDPLVAGIVDYFESNNLQIFGPKKNAAIIEGSKLFCRELLKKYNIPSAEFGGFSDSEKAKEYVIKKGAPIVIKADGLTLGKGVFVCETIKEALNAIDTIILKNAFGNAGKIVVIEEKLIGEEASFFVFSDGKNIKALPSSQDHKRIFDGDNGPNTGGMGAYSPAPIVDAKIKKQILEEIMKPTIEALNKEGRKFIGVLYGGIMITKNCPKVVEFNCRFGDPETQALLPRLESDLVEIMLACINGTLEKQEIECFDNACCTVVLASSGYPGTYEKGREIFGLTDTKNLKNVFIFHAGTKLENGKIFTSGGRVLNVTATGTTIKESIDNAYKVVPKINFEGVQYRKDIGRKALKY